MNQISILIVCLSLAYVAEAGIRCSIGGDTACSLGCKVLGQSGGTCDDDNKCWCSELPFDLDDLRESLPSRCDLGESVCQGTCNAIGRKTGKCVGGAEGCECSDERISPEEFALCASESTCGADCQRRGKASGQCNGWQCECLSNQSRNF